MKSLTEGFRESLNKFNDSLKQSVVLIQNGQLVKEAALTHLEPDQLYGALLSLAEQAKNPDTLKEWELKGKAAQQLK